MMMKTLAAMAVVSMVAIVACGGKGQGDECGGTSDECGSNLACQPIKGRGKSYCCPTPPETSSEDNCHPKL